jgi:hypothetical protein
VDQCGVCGGANACLGCDGVPNSGKTPGCDGVCGSGKIVDQCGACGGANSCLGCDGVPNSGVVAGCDGVCGSGKVVDQCGACGGANACLGCDGVPNSGKVVDACGVCGGNGSTCAGTLDVTASGYWASSTLHLGLPPGNYVELPSALTHSQLDQLQQDCIDRINAYRSGALKFSNGTSDPGVPKPALTHLMGADVCSTDQALGDLYVNNGAGGCAGAHTNAFSCPFSGHAGQNTCCSRSGSTYSAIQSQLYNCLQQMWDEGTELPDNTAYSSAVGHWYNMRNSQFGYASCGFAFSSANVVWMNQDFTGGQPSGVPVTCSCAGKQVGDPDGCGRTCVSN